jgi:maleylpyruvate isomerase
MLREIIADSAGGDWPAMILRPWGTDHALTIGPAPDSDAASRTADLSPAADARPVIGGPTKSLAAWLAGRADGADLTVSPDGELPVPARWK